MRFSSLHLCQAPNSNNALMGKIVLCNGWFFSGMPQVKNWIVLFLACSLALTPTLWLPYRAPRKEMAWQKDLEVHSDFSQEAPSRLIPISRFPFSRLSRNNDNIHRVLGQGQQGCKKHWFPACYPGAAQQMFIDCNWELVLVNCLAWKRDPALSAGSI